MNAKIIFEKVENTLRENEKLLDEVEFIENKNDYTIKFFKSAVIKINNGKRNYVYVKSRYKDRLILYLNFHEVKSMPNWVRFEVITNKEIDDVLSVVVDMYEDMYYQSSAFEIFSCCSRYEQCSDELKCVNPDVNLAKGCMYKLNLEAGKIFYGKNKI